MPARWLLPEGTLAARAARAHVATEVADWSAVEDIELVASELTANAVDHGAPPIYLAMEIVDGSLRVTVTNTSALEVPRVRDAAEVDSRGRGLALVQAVSSAWGWEREGDLMHVWAEFSPA